MPPSHPFLVVTCLACHFYFLSLLVYVEFLLMLWNSVQIAFSRKPSGLSYLLSLCSSGNTLLWAFLTVLHICHCLHCVAFWWPLCDNLPGLVVGDLRTGIIACSPLPPTCLAPRVYRITNCVFFNGYIEGQWNYKKRNKSLRHFIYVFLFVLPQFY